MSAFESHPACRPFSVVVCTQWERMRLSSCMSAGTHTHTHTQRERERERERESAYAVMVCVGYYTVSKSGKNK